MFGLALIGGMLVSGAASADQDDTINLNAGIGYLHDSNLFRLSPEANTKALLGKDNRDDQITTTSLGIAFRKALGLQVFEAGWDRLSNRYATYTHLDSDINNRRMAWRWQLTPSVKGNLAYNQTQSMVGFADYSNYATQNIRRITTYRVDADWNILPGGWHLITGVDRYETTNSQTYTQDEGSRITSTDVALRHVFSSGNWADLSGRAGRGEFPNRKPNDLSQFDNNFDDRRAEFRANWSHGKSTLRGGVGYSTREYEHYEARNYSGAVGNLAWQWQPTGKTGLLLSWKRDLAAFTDQTSSYYLQDVFSIMPIWQADAKLRLGVKFDHARRDYRGAITTAAYTPRNDRITSAKISLDWTPLRTLTINAYWSQEGRNSSLAMGDYSARQIGVNLRAEF